MAENNDGFSLFGFQIKRKSESEKELSKRPSFVPPSPEDGVGEVINAGGYYGQYVDIDGSGTKSESDLIYKYRDISQNPECDAAIEDIVNESIVSDDATAPVSLNLDDFSEDEMTDKIKELIYEEFNHVVELLDFNFRGHDIFRRWYIDGKIYYHKVLDPKSPKKGILELRYIDPTRIRKVREIKEEYDEKTRTKMVTGIDEYFIYQNQTLTQMSQGLKISPDAITYVTSGITDSSRKRVLSYLHKALKPVNQLRMMEDSLVIYRLSRAPERRIFYIDVGNLPKGKAEEYMRNIMSKYRNKMVYDANTGEMRDDRKHMSMLEDFWLPRKEGGRGTEISTLPGGCLAMDTKVPLLDGRELTIAEIADEMNSGEELWTYSCNPETGAIAPGLISWAGVTQKSAEVMKLTLDNGEQITCTLDHKFPVWNKGFVEAKDLSVNDSIIPFNSRKQQISSNSDNKRDYEQVFDNELKKWVYTHRMIRDQVDLPHWTYDSRFDGKEKNVVHHIDHDRHNNSPDNLVMMNWHDHFKYHADHAGFPSHAAKLGSIAAAARLEKMKNENPEEYKAYTESISKRMKLLWDTDEFRSNTLTAMNDYWDNISDEEKNYRDQVSRNNFYKGTQRLQELLTDPEYKEWYSQQISSGWTDELRAERSQFATELNNRIWNNPDLGVKRRQRHKEIQKLEFDYEMLMFIIDLVKGKTTHEVTLNDVVNELNNSERMLELLKTLNKHKNVPNWNVNCGYSPTIVNKIIKEFGYTDGWKQFRKECNNQNHKIVGIEYLPNEIEVGTLTIDQDHLVHDFHTFALSAGIFTKNSNLGQIDDIIYFQQNLYKSLNVPLNRLEQDSPFSMGRATEITRDELKFQKFIARLRKKFSVLFMDILKTQLISKGVVNETEWKEISQKMRINFMQDNHFYELKNAELIRDRLNMMRDMGDYIGRYFSEEWVRKNVLQQTDSEIENMDGQIKDEIKSGRYPDPTKEDQSRRF